MTTTTTPPPVHGRGGWTKVGMPANGSEYYEYITPVNVGTLTSNDQSHRAVNFGVRTIQTRINEMGFANPNNSPLTVNGVLDLRSAMGIGWAQRMLGVAVDGQAGPITLSHMLWPYINAMPYNETIRHTVGGICRHESNWDPGAVGYEDPDDLGLVQINGPANPTMSEAERFDYHIAFKYAADRIAAALGTPGYTLDAAIASYGYPAVAQAWVKSGKQQYPKNPALNTTVLTYVAFIKDWKAPS